MSIPTPPSPREPAAPNPGQAPWGPPRVWGAPLWPPQPRPLSCRSRSPTRTRRQCSWLHRTAPPVSSALRRAPPRPEGPRMGGETPPSCAPAGDMGPTPPIHVFPAVAGSSCAPPPPHPGVLGAHGCHARVLGGCARTPLCLCVPRWLEAPTPPGPPTLFIAYPPQFQVPLAVIKLVVRPTLAVPTGGGAAGSAPDPHQDAGAPDPQTPPPPPQDRQPGGGPG